jgi:hypothetical protein
MYRILVEKVSESLGVKGSAQSRNRRSPWRLGFSFED